MIFSKGQSILFNGKEHTVIETNYLGIKVQNDETGVFAFVKASDADKALMLIESEVSIKPVADKRFSGDDRKVSELRTARKLYLRSVYAGGPSTMGRVPTPEHRAKLNAGAQEYRARMVGKPETPIEVLRKLSKARTIKE